MRVIVELEENDELGKKIIKSLKDLTEEKKEEPKAEITVETGE